MEARLLDPFATYTKVQETNQSRKGVYKCVPGVILSSMCRLIGSALGVGGQGRQDA